MRVLLLLAMGSMAACSSFQTTAPGVSIAPSVAETPYRPGTTIKRSPPNNRALASEIGRPVDGRKALQEAQREHGRIDVLVLFNERIGLKLTQWRAGARGVWLADVETSDSEGTAAGTATVKVFTESPQAYQAGGSSIGGLASGLEERALRGFLEAEAGVMDRRMLLRSESFRLEEFDLFKAESSALAERVDVAVEMHLVADQANSSGYALVARAVSTKDARLLSARSSADLPHGGRVFSEFEAARGGFERVEYEEQVSLESLLDQILGFVMLDLANWLEQ